MFELSQRFFFEAAHTLHRDIEAEGSRRVHGHTYDVEVTVAGSQNPVSGMVVDLGSLRHEIARVREKLDHRFLDEEAEVMSFGPATLENLARFIAHELRWFEPTLLSVRISRAASGDSCTYRVATAR
jgi:6-pyruvoyltetrahydropterin/6-carboxytetrahydropterin synthase